MNFIRVYRIAEVGAVKGLIILAADNFAITLPCIIIQASSGRGAVWLARTVRVGEVVGSNPAAPTGEPYRNDMALFLFPSRMFLDSYRTKLLGIGQGIVGIAQKEQHSHSPICDRKGIIHNCRHVVAIFPYDGRKTIHIVCTVGYANGRFRPRLPTNN